MKKSLSKIYSFFESGRAWTLYFPIILLVTEFLLSSSHLYEQYHYAIALRDQPLASTYHLIVHILRSYLTYAFFTTSFELLVGIVPIKFRRLVCIGFTRQLLFLLLYALASRHVFVSSPSISFFYESYFPKHIFFLVALLIPIQFAIYSWRPPAGPPPVFATHKAIIPLFFLVSLFSTASHPRSASPEFENSGAELPSFLLLGFDGIPEPTFASRTGDNFVAPLWHSRWEDKAIYYKNAYSFTNSTFTSWFSMLSGMHPVNSGVETLYPHHREGNTPVSQLLPNKLKAKGYKTVFMTDCGATSYMKPSYGFDELHQLGTGVFECGKSLLLSKHPLAWFLGNPSTRSLFLPELDSFCSAQYRPETFFERVKETVKRLERESTPYFLAVHSCVSHQSIIYQPPMSSPLRRALPSTLYENSERLKTLMLSTRVADYFLDDILSKVESLSSRPWTFFFSDHGTRIDMIEGKHKYFTHAMGHPVNAFQYRVPLALLPPSNRTKHIHDSLVSLSDIYPTINELAETAYHSEDTRSLLPTSSNELSQDRSILLTSAMPMILSPDVRAMFDAFWENKLDSHGFHAFPPSLEHRLLSKRPIALLKLPYRLVLTPGAPIRLFDEVKDPYGEHNIASKYPETVETLLEQLCDSYKGAGCNEQQTAKLNIN